MKADATTEAAVKAVLDRLAEVYVVRDAALLDALFAPDPDVVMYSPGADDKCLGLSEIKAKAERDWSKTEAASLTYRSTSISATASVAWVATHADFRVRANGQEATLPTRITFILEKRGQAWLIVHAHYSFPATAAPR